MNRRRATAVLVLLAAVGVVVGAVVSSGSPSKPSSANRSLSSGATVVERRDLVETDTEPGTLGYAHGQTVYDRLSGTITWLPSVGQVVKPGGTLFKVDGKPVILMDGSTPAYRALDSSDSAGEDILQLNRNLVALGFNPGRIVVDDEWQWATTVGVEALQDSLRETETGSLSLGQVAFLPGARLVSSVEATLGDTGGSPGASNPSSTTARIVNPTAKPEFVSVRATLRTTSTTTRTRPITTTSTTVQPTSTTPTIKSQPPTSSVLAQLEREVAKLNTEVARLTAGGRSPGGAQPRSASPSGGSSPTRTTVPTSSSSPSGGGSPSPVLETTSTRLVVTVDLDASKQSEAKLGDKVTVELPDGDTVGGRIAAVSAVAQASNTSGGNSNGNNGGASAPSATIPITIVLRSNRADAGLDQATVSVNFEQQEARNVLSVPVTALLAQAGGSYAVQEAVPPYALLAITPGLFAAGYVQISGPGIHQGLQVTDSQG